MHLRFATLISLFGLSCGLIDSLTIDNDDRPTFLIDSFGFEKGGQFKIEIHDFSLMVKPNSYTPPADEKYKVGFVLQMSTVDDTTGSEYNGGSNVGIKTRCFHESSIRGGDELISMASRTDWTSRTFEKTIEKPGYYHLYFSNCEPDTLASFTLTLTEYNVDEKGQKSYLSAGESSLPTWFGVLCAMFVVELIVWVFVLRKEKANIRSIHHLMTACLILKIFTLFFEALKEHQTKVTGLKNDGWTVMYYIFSFLKGMLMFTVIVLIGTGWSYLKPFLTDRDKQLMLAVLVAQIMINIAMVVVDETTPGSAGWMNWRDILHLLDIICCCIILLPIVWSIRHLREASAVDGKAATNFARLKNFRSFYLLVVSYVYFTRIIVFLLGATLPFEVTWLSYVFSELASLAFYGLTGYLFRPQPVNPYLALSKDDDDAGRSPEAEMADL